MNCRPIIINFLSAPFYFFVWKHWKKLEPYIIEILERGKSKDASDRSLKDDAKTRLDTELFLPKSLKIVKVFVIVVNACITPISGFMLFICISLAMGWSTDNTFTTGMQAFMLFFSSFFIINTILYLTNCIRYKKEIKRMATEIKEERKKKERDRTILRDSDTQNINYRYEIGQHAKETLALRYGLIHNSNTIELRKIKKVAKNKYKVILAEYYHSKYGKKEAIAIIEKGTEYVKTFYPISDDWFDKYQNLESKLKNSGAFTLKELATFNINLAN